MAPTNVVAPFDAAVLELVQYRCSCGSLRPICKLYFCRHCLDIRCGFCVSHEVDSHYCPNCMENMPSAEARLKKNRCANCFDCPHCSHTLSTRATSMAAPSPEDPAKMVAKKVYYLACAFCRWTSRDIGLPDQTVASGGWPEVESPHSARIAGLQEHYRAIAQREKVEKESRRFFGRKLSYLQLSDKYGLTNVVARKRAGLPPLSLGPGREEVGRPVDLAPAEAVDLDSLADLPMDLITEQLDLAKLTKLPQRLAQLETQPLEIGDIFPRHKHLMIKRSQRCRRCEHNLSKPEYNPTSIKFKIQLAAYYHVPELVIYKVDKLVAGVQAKFVIKVVNPTNTGTEFEFLSMKAYQAIRDQEEAEKAEARARGEEKEDRPVSAINPLRQPSIVAAEDGSRDLVTADVILPSSKVYLPPRDDAAEFDDGGVDLAGHQDDREVVQWRKSNKVGLQLGVIPREGGKVVVGFGIQYQYTNTVFALDSKEVHTATMRIPVFLNLGTAQTQQ